MAYNNPTPVAVAIVRVRRNDGSLALLVLARKLAPVGGKAFPGGYVDEMETAREAAARELREETRFITSANQWRLIQDAISPQNLLLLFCEFLFEIPESALELFYPTKEASAVFCTTAQSELCFSLHQDAAAGYLAFAAEHEYPSLLPAIDTSPDQVIIFNLDKEPLTYNNPLPAALAVVRVRRTDGSLALLGIVRKRTPTGGTALPGGYVDEMETAKVAAARELWEEARLVTDATQWRLLDDRISAQNRLLIFCEFMFEIPEDLLAEFVPTAEVSAVLCLTLDSEICFPNHEAVARAYLAQTTAHAYPKMRPVMDMSPGL